MVKIKNVYYNIYLLISYIVIKHTIQYTRNRESGKYNIVYFDDFNIFENIN